MAVSIEVSNEQLAALKAKAAAQGLTLQDWLKKLADKEAEPTQPGQPFKSGYGMLAKYGPAPWLRKSRKIAKRCLRLRKDL